MQWSKSGGCQIHNKMLTAMCIPFVRKWRLYDKINNTEFFFYNILKWSLQRYLFAAKLVENERLFVIQLVRKQLVLWRAPFICQFTNWIAAQLVKIVRVFSIISIYLVHFCVNRILVNVRQFILFLFGKNAIKRFAINISIRAAKN